MMAQVLRKIPLINKMMRWAESKRLNCQKQQDVLDIMTQYGVESQEKLFVESEDEQEQQDNLELCKQ